MADVGLVIKEGGVVVPSEQQGAAFQNNCTHSLPKSLEAPEKNGARDHPGRQFFPAGSGLYIAVWAPHLNVSLI